MALSRTPLWESGDEQTDLISLDAACGRERDVADRFNLLLCGATRILHPELSSGDWTRARLACADVGLEPNSSAFDGCVFDLYYTLWNEQNAGER